MNCMQLWRHCDGSREETPVCLLLERHPRVFCPECFLPWSEVRIGYHGCALLHCIPLDGGFLCSMFVLSHSLGSALCYMQVLKGPHIDGLSTTAAGALARLLRVAPALIPAAVQAGAANIACRLVQSSDHRLQVCFHSFPRFCAPGIHSAYRSLAEHRTFGSSYVRQGRNVLYRCSSTLLNVDCSS